jgi:hypothetical protein
MVTRIERINAEYEEIKKANLDGIEIIIDPEYFGFY